MKNKISEFYQKVKTFVQNNKWWSGIIIVAILIVGYYGYPKLFPTATTVQYTFGKVTKGDLVITVAGSGQVSTLSKVSLKPQTTGQTQTLGQIVSVKVQNGDNVKAGQVVAILDGKNALQTLNQAKASYTSAQANYDKVISGLTESQLTSLNISIDSAATSLDNSKQNIILSLRNAYSSVSNLLYLNTDAYFTDPMTINPKLTISDVNFINQQIQNNVEQGRYNIGPLLNTWRDKVKTQSELVTSSTSDDYIIGSINSTLSDLNIVRNYFDDMTTLFALYSVSSNSTGQTAINSAKSAASTARSSVDSLISSFTSSLQSYNNLITSLAQAKDSLRLQQEPPEASVLATAQSSLDNAKANLANAETAYASRIITAPFDGQIGGLTASVGQQVSSSDSLGTLITAEKVINVTLNEVDAAKVSAGNIVTITFDSLPGISLTGYVGYMDPLGTVTQGVVSYSVQIKMNEQNDQIKTAMTASVAIVTNQHSNTLMIPTSAITTVGGKKFVLVADTSSSTVSDFGGNFNAGSSTRNFGTSTRSNFASSTFASTTATSSRRQFRNNFASSTKSATNGSTQFPVTQFEITTGIANNTMTEVLSGLSEGQLIVTKKTTVSSTASTVKTTAASATTNTRGGFGGGGFGGGAVGAMRAD